MLTITQLAKKYHPDANKDDPNAHKKFTEISNAYEVRSVLRYIIGLTMSKVLQDDQKRATYDQQGHDMYTQTGGQDHGGFSGFSNADDILRHFGFDVFGGMGGEAGRFTGNDLQVQPQAQQQPLPSHFRTSSATLCNTHNYNRCQSH